MRLGADGDDRVERAADEVRELQLDDRPLALPRGAERCADEALLGDRGVDDALGTELLPQPLRDAERAAEVADVLAEQEDALVLGERVAQRRVDGVEKRRVAQTETGSAGGVMGTPVGSAGVSTEAGISPVSPSVRWSTGSSAPGTSRPRRETTLPLRTRAG